MIFGKKKRNYVSDFTLFLHELKEKDPDLELKQRNGRLLLWDKGPIDLDLQHRAKESSVKQQAYVYQPKY